MLSDMFHFLFFPLFSCGSWIVCLFYTLCMIVIWQYISQVRDPHLISHRSHCFGSAHLPTTDSLNAAGMRTKPHTKAGRAQSYCMCGTKQKALCTVQKEGERRKHQNTAAEKQNLCVCVCVWIKTLLHYNLLTTTHWQPRQGACLRCIK